MTTISKNLFSNFDINFLSKNIFSLNTINKYYKESLTALKKRTRCDYIISCQNMLFFILLWVLHPEQGYATILSKAKSILIKYSKNISEIGISITAAGLCKARKRFNSIIFKKIWQLQAINNYYKENGLKLWKNFTVCAIDGTTFTLKKTANILKKFPTYNFSKLPKMASSLLYDLYSKIPLDIEFDTCPGDERGMLCKIIKRIKRKTLLVLDRGYPSFWIFYLLSKFKIEFIIRIPKYFNYKIKKKLSQSDFIIELCPKKNNYKYKKYLTKEEYKKMPRKVILRLIITKIKGYRPRELVTSLTDNNNYTYNDIAKLYCDRWIIEVYYRELKHILKVENFHSEYVDGVYQEIFASKILTIILQKYILK